MHALSKEEIASGLSDLSLDIPRLDAMRHGIELFGATRFSILEMFKPDENTLSRVVAELFDPRGSHGQGLLFTNALLEMLGFQRVGSREPVRVRREVTTRNNRRIDIVIDTRDYVIGVENKPWAIQQDNQLGDYLDELEADLLGRRPILLFISDQKPETAQDSAYPIPYYAEEGQRSLYGLLSGHLEKIKASQPRAFVQDFMRYIKTTFGGVDLGNESDRPYIDAVRAEFDSPAKRKAIAAVLLAQYPLHEQIVNEISEFLRDELIKSTGGEWGTRDEYSAADWLSVPRQPWGVRRPHWRDNCYLALEAQGPWFSKLIVGLKAPDPDRIPQVSPADASPERELLKDFAKKFSGGKATPWWAWHQPLLDATWDAEFAARTIIESPTGQVRDHPHIQELARLFVELGKAADHLLGK